MKNKLSGLTIASLYFAKLLAVVGLATIALCNPAARAVTIANDPVKLEGGKADFGSGLHLLGSPTGPGNVRWDYSTDASGHLIATARVTGTLYLDSSSGGKVRITIEFRGRNTDGSVGALLSSVVKYVNAGDAFWGALDSTHQRQIDESFTSSTLHFVVLTTRVVRSDGSLTSGASATSSPPDASYHVKVSGLGSQAADFRGDLYGEHQYADEHAASVDFTRVNGAMNANVSGTLYWASQNNAGTARLLVEYLDVNGNVLNSQHVDVFGSGGDPNLARNKTSVNLSLSNGRLWQVRLTVGVVVGTQFSSQDHEVVRFH